MMLSIIIPVYNEERTIHEILERVKFAPFNKEIIIIDDGSTDGTREYLTSLAAQKEQGIIIVFQDKNYGKTKAIKTGLTRAQGDIVIIQDADLEYNPKDYAALIESILSGQTGIVYGSRNLANNPIGNKFYLLGVRFLSMLANILYGTRLTDVYTGYKAFKTSIIKGIDLEYNRFEFCLEATAKLRKQGHTILEVPISYHPRSKSEGKKIRSRDGIKAVLVLLRLRF